MTPRNIFNLAVKTLKEWKEDQASRLAAALAYYTTFSLAPLLVVVISAAGLLGGRDAAQGLVMNQIQDLVGEEGREFIQDMVTRASVPSTGIAASVIGTVTLLAGALGAFNELQHSLNSIWDVEAKPLKGWSGRIRDFLLKRLLSFSMLTAIAFLLLVSLVVSAGISALNEYLAGISYFSEVVLQIINLVVSLVLITLLFGLIFKYIPDVKVGWRYVWPGAALTAILFSIGKQLIGIYLGQSSVGSSFGAAGSLALIMIWIYYSAQILFLGAEFTQVFANSEKPPKPTVHAQPAT